jgi:tetratricopeptide (TPR) repeat protein
VFAVCAGQAIAGDPSEAERQLGLAEADLAAGNPERASQAAASVLRLDPGLLTAFVVKAIAYRELGRLEEARALLLTYIDLRGSLPRDARADPTLTMLSADLQGFDATRALDAAEEAIFVLRYDAAETYLGGVRASDPAEEVLRRLLSLEASVAWAQERPKDANKKWVEIFTRYPEEQVPDDIQPDIQRAMSDAFNHVAIQRALTKKNTPTGPPRVASGPRMPPAEVGILFGAGAGATAAGFSIAGGAHGRGTAMLPSLRETGASWDANSGEYVQLQNAERAGAVLGAVGSAALVGGLVRLIVDRVAAGKRERAGGSLTLEPAQ